MNIKQLFVTGLLGSSLFLSGCQQPIPNILEDPVRFTELPPTQVHESYLTKAEHALPFSNPFYDQYVSLVREEESYIRFVPLEKSEAGVSRGDTYVALERNFELIAFVDETPFFELPRSLLPLKRLVDSLNKVHENKEFSQTEKAEALYGVMIQHITDKQPTLTAETIDVVVREDIGNCNDLVAAYAAVYNYYDISCYMRFDRGINVDNSEREIHAWLTLELDDFTIDLDPTYNRHFVPLQERNAKAERAMLKEEYMLKKERM